MSTTLSTPPETGLGVFRDITPGGIPRNRENSTWAVASLGGTLYLAVVSHDVQTVQRYQAGKWETAYQKIVRRAKGEEPGELPAMQLVTGESHHGPAIYLKITDGGATEYLRSSENGSTLESVPEHFDDVEKAFAEANSLPAELPDHPASARYTHSFTLGGKTAVTLDDPVLGCSAWVKGETWQPVFIRGAHRFSDNAEVFAAEAWDGAVIFALGKFGPAPLGKTLPGFELVRVYSDGSWDLLIGTPRVSNQGLKVPLACIAPGMNDFSPTHFCFLSAGKNHLLLGTYDDLAGFRIWRSADGINWGAGEAELVGIDRVSAAQAKRIAGGTAIAFEIDSPQDKHTRAIWIGV